MRSLRASGALMLAYVALLASVGCERGTSDDAPRPASSTAATATAAVAPTSLPSAAAKATAAEEIAYVGGGVCAVCHSAETSAWRGSDHDLAMQEATAETVLGDFADAAFTKDAVTTRFRRDGEEFVVHTEGRDGTMADFPVRYVFGVRPLQQVLLDVGGGRLQAFPIAWDVDEKRWFDLYPAERIPPDDPLHWTRFALNWNQGCAECHSTFLQKRYDVAADVYATTWSEIDVSCEACHGPGERHVAWARAAATGGSPADPEARKGLLTKLDLGPFPGRDRTRQIEQIDVCGPCHARRSLLHPDAWARPFLDAYRPELLSEGLYHADGQILDEVYEYGSFTQSRMFHEGVACSDCHDPHSLKLRAEGNALCLQCHEAARFDVTAHTHHPAGSPGAQCVSCHMAETTYMQIDERRDHGFHIPRPDLTVELGVPNACQRCHADRGPGWAHDRIVEWFGPERPADVHGTRAIAGGRAQEKDASAALAALVADPARSAIVRATALTLLRSYDDAPARSAAAAALRDPEALVRGTAIENVAAQATTPADFEKLVPLLGDPSRWVRTEAARVLSGLGPERFPNRDAAEARRFEPALLEYRLGQRASADQPAAHMNLGVLEQNQGDAAGAREEYAAALRIDPSFVPARFNLAMLEALAGRREEAEAGFREVIRIAPELAEARYSLGLLLAEDPARLEEAASVLREAARAAPGNARMQYNAGLALQHLGGSEAEAFLRAAVNLSPDDPEFRNALAIFYVQQGRFDEALPQARRLVELAPGDPRAASLLAQVEQRAGAKP